MADIQLVPYLYLDGTTADAMRFYQSVFGGELMMQTFEEAKASQVPEDRNRIMYANLRNDSISIMASDGHPMQQVKFGDNFHLSLHGTDEKQLTDTFNKLAEGGMIDLPLEKQFWGDKFGMLTDKFGVHWMVNISAQARM
jgi:PhnB protein